MSGRRSPGRPGSRRRRHRRPSSAAGGQAVADVGRHDQRRVVCAAPSRAPRTPDRMPRRSRRPRRRCRVRSAAWIVVAFVLSRVGGERPSRTTGPGPACRARPATPGAPPPRPVSWCLRRSAATARVPRPPPEPKVSAMALRSSRRRARSRGAENSLHHVLLGPAGRPVAQHRADRTGRPQVPPIYHAALVRHDRTWDRTAAEDRG